MNTTAPTTRIRLFPCTTIHADGPCDGIAVLTYRNGRVYECQTCKSLWDTEGHPLMKGTR